MILAHANLLQSIKSGLDEIVAIAHTEDGVRVTTHCMYPSNGLVQVTVRGGANTIVASDEGGAIGEAVSAGIPVRDYDGKIVHLVRDQGLIVRAGVVFTPQVPLETAPMAVLLVANASQDIARWLFEHTKIRRTRDFKLLLADFLRRRFDNRLSHDTVIIGHSNKPHRFANVVSLSSGKRLIIDPVTNDPSSINARVVANFDVRATNDPLLDQRIIYDDEDEWTPADLNLLQVGATVVPFSRSPAVIERLAANAGAGD
jgi:hypothetical protein